MPPTLQKEYKIMKKDRKSLSFEVKLQILKRLESGVHRTSVAREFGLADSTVRYIMKNSDKIKKHFTESTLSQPPQRYYARVSIYAALENHLFSWIEDMRAMKIMPVTPTMVKNEAKRVFKELKQTHKGPETFNASVGWYKNFERAAREKKIDITGRVAQVASVDFPTRLNRYIESNEHPTKLVFNVCTTELHWKQIPQTVSSLETRNTSSNSSSFNVLLCSNATGDALLPPLIVSRSDATENIQFCVDHNISIEWRLSCDGQVTREIFRDWFKSCFCPFLKDYCATNSLETKILLLMDNLLCKSGDICNNKAGIYTEVLYIPKDVLQPLNQGATTIFKAIYMYQLLEQTITDINGVSIEHDQQVISERLESFNLMKSLRIISETWLQMEPCVMKGVWSGMLPGAESWSGTIDADKDMMISAIIDKINNSTLGNVTVSEVESILTMKQNSHINYLENNVDDDVFSTQEDDEDNVHNEMSAIKNNFGSEQREEKVLTLPVVESALRHMDTALNLLEKHDGDTERIASVTKAITDGVACYRTMLDYQMGKPKQNSIYGFLKSITKKSPIPVPDDL